MADRSDEIKGYVSGGRFRVIDWPKPRVSNPNLLREEFERFEREMKEREASQQPPAHRGTGA